MRNDLKVLRDSSGVIPFSGGSHRSQPDIGIVCERYVIVDLAPEFFSAGLYRGYRHDGLTGVLFCGDDTDRLERSGRHGKRDLYTASVAVDPCDDDLSLTGVNIVAVFNFVVDSFFERMGPVGDLVFPDNFDRRTYRFAGVDLTF